jgi:hypothetical protein
LVHPVFSGKALADFELEVSIVAVSVYRTLDQLNFVVDAFQHAAVQYETSVPRFSKCNLPENDEHPDLALGGMNATI